MVIPLIIYSVMLENAFVKHFKAVVWFFIINQFYGFLQADNTIFEAIFDRMTVKHSVNNERTHAGAYS